MDLLSNLDPARVQHGHSSDLNLGPRLISAWAHDGSVYWVQISLQISLGPRDSDQSTDLDIDEVSHPNHLLSHPERKYIAQGALAAKQKLSTNMAVLSDPESFR